MCHTCLAAPSFTTTRLINDTDKEYFKRMLVELCNKNGLGVGSYDDLFVARSVMFGDFLRMGVERSERKYEEVADAGRLVSLLEEYLDEYNLSNTNALNLGEWWIC